LFQPGFVFLAECSHPLQKLRFNRDEVVEGKIGKQGRVDGGVLFAVSDQCFDPVILPNELEIRS